MKELYSEHMHIHEGEIIFYFASDKLFLMWLILTLIKEMLLNE
jgi:hypothetical protein